MSSALQTYTVTPRELFRMLKVCLEAGQVPFIQGPPGCGKSALGKLLAKHYQLFMIDHRTSTSVPEDVSGLPGLVDGKAMFHAFEELFPLDTTPIPAGFQGWLLFLDEFNSGAKSVQAAFYKVVLDRMVGQRHLNQRVAILTAGNQEGDRAIVNSLSTAMQSRLIHFTLRVDATEWLEDVAYAQGFDPRISAYIQYKPTSLMKFDPAHVDRTFPCPRTWEFMHTLIHGREVLDQDIALYAGAIGSGEALSFLAFTKHFASLPTYSTIIGNPTGTPVPKDTPVQFAAISHLIDTTEPASFDKVVLYVGRFNPDFQIVYYRGLGIRQPKLIDRPEFAQAMSKLSGKIHGKPAAAKP